MIGSSYLQLQKENSCSVKLQGRNFDHNPRKILVEYSCIKILRNNSKCLLLNDKQIPHEILLSLLDKIKTRKKYEYTRIERKEILKKAREIGYVALIFL